MEVVLQLTHPRSDLVGLPPAAPKPGDARPPAAPAPDDARPPTALRARRALPPAAPCARPCSRRAAATATAASRWSSRNLSLRSGRHGQELRLPRPGAWAAAFLKAAWSSEQPCNARSRRGAARRARFPWPTPAISSPAAQRAAATTEAGRQQCGRLHGLDGVPERGEEEGEGRHRGGGENEDTLTCGPYMTVNGQTNGQRDCLFSCGPDMS